MRGKLTRRLAGRRTVISATQWRGGLGNLVTPQFGCPGPRAIFAPGAQFSAEWPGGPLEG
jgi:hypothetical protein